MLVFESTRIDEHLKLAKVEFHRVLSTMIPDIFVFQPWSSMTQWVFIFDLPCIMEIFRDHGIIRDKKATTCKTRKWVENVI